ncbi:TonB-dependent receptor [Mucilaginibacter sp. KACC 22063]|uniref:TonB-dependent receptor n=1 Tax=Mucilaginibacter sp. KACC 22063 TaxID=3025666 RepID=UPI002366E894|nr:TonB-dependent receptor [Mucilaginibacter sp. KACC 22063]WDF54510.1 TonB-dependent receptor [Mucilaginibacter sp. KACC 22063]
MKSAYLFSLLVLGSVACFTPADAQTNQKPKTKKTTAKPAATTAKKLGDVAAKTAAKDTTKKGGGNNPANPNGQQGSSLSEEIVVTTNYKPVLADAVKIRRNPNLEDVSPYKAPLTYSTLDKRLEQNSAIKQLDAMPLPRERDSVLNNNYVKVGAGNLKTTFGEAYINNGKDEAMQIGAWLKHFAQSGSDVNKQNQSRQEIGVFGKSIMDDNSLSGRIWYNRQSNYFYGYAQNTTPVTTDPFHQHFNTISAEGELAKNYKDTERVFNYALKAKGYLFSNALKARENDIVLTGFINQTIKQFYAGVSGTLDMSSQKDNAYNITNNIFRANPYLKFQGDNYKIDAGVNIATEFGFSSRFYVFPSARAEVQVIPDYVRVFAEAKGDINRASLRDYAETNPFIGQDINIRNSVDRIDITAGIKGTLAPGLGFKAQIYRNEVKDMPLYVSNIDAQGNNRFAVVYDDGTTRVSGFKGELNYKASDDFELFGKVDFKDYKTSSQWFAWNMPKFNLTAGTIIHITDKFNLTGSLLLRGETKDITYTNALLPLDQQKSITPYTIKSFADVSAGGEYKINKKLSVFVQANNLLNSNYREWLFYRNYGFNIFGGVGYGF